MPLPILMYHKVGAPVKGKADTFLNVPAQSFRRHMLLLKRMGYEGVTLAEGVAWLAAGRTLPRKPVCVTFDDGYQNVGEHASPILRELGWPATVFVPTAFVGGVNEWDREAEWPLLPIMDWPVLERLTDAGWEMAGHTRTHPRLDRIDDEAAANEIAGGQEDLTDRLGPATRTFCYPFGGLNDRTPALVKQAGFTAACTTESGLATETTDSFLLPRVKIGYRDGIAGFLYRLLIRPHL